MYQIFLTKGDYICFKCSKKGHKAENCIETSYIEEEVEDNVSNTVPPSQLKISNTSLSTRFPPLNPPKTPVVAPQQLANNKRGISEIVSSTGSDTLTADNYPTPNHTDSHKQDNTQLKQRKPKKAKPNTEAYLKPLILTPHKSKEITAAINHTRQTKYTNCDFSATELIKLIPSLRGTSNKRQLAEDFTTNLDCLLFILEEIKPWMEPGTKRTITSFIKIFNAETNQSDSSDT